MTDLTSAAATPADPSEELARVTVWGKPKCVQCEATGRDLTRKGIQFDEKSLLDHPDKLEKFRQLNFLQAPIVTFDDMIWSGFRPDMHEELQKRMSA